jgi:hypothetical protein
MPVPVTDNLWPTDFGQEETLSPVAILRQQGLALGERTQNIVVGRVATFGITNGFRHILYLFCAPLAYQIELLTVEHSIDFYPAKITVFGEASPPQTAVGPDDFVQKLAAIFASEANKKIIRSLLAQSKQ